jgi:hypothetical protein
MLNDIHNAIRQLVHTYGRIDPVDVDVKFDTPSDEWVTSLTRPTISMFLFDVQENTEKRETNMQLVRGNGKAERRLPPRRIDLCYMVSALTADVEDEHELLWRALATLMKYREFPREVLSDSLKLLDTAITTRIAVQQESRQLLELWNSLGTKPHVGLSYVITAPLDLDVSTESPLVLTRTARYRRLAHGDPDVFTQIGGVVCNSSGQPIADAVIATSFSGEQTTTDSAGQYRLRDVPSGKFKLTVLRQSKVQKQIELSVPATSYDIVVDE